MRGRLKIPFFDAETQRRRENAEPYLDSPFVFCCASLRLGASASELVTFKRSLRGML